MTGKIIAEMGGKLVIDKVKDMIHENGLTAFMISIDGIKTLSDKGEAKRMSFDVFFRKALEKKGLKQLAVITDGGDKVVLRVVDDENTKKDLKPSELMSLFRNSLNKNS